MTYQIVLLDGNNISYRVANIATNDNKLAAGTTFVGSKFLVLHIVSPKSNDERRGGNERERPISYRIASCNAICDKMGRLRSFPPRRLSLLLGNTI